MESVKGQLILDKCKKGKKGLNHDERKILKNSVIQAMMRQSTV